MTDYNGVSPAIAKALQKRGYTELTPVQKAMLDPALAASDALVSAQTGSGKTVAFGLALAPTLLEDNERFASAAAPVALVIAPTRELALQVKRNATGPSGRSTRSRLSNTTTSRTSWSASTRTTTARTSSASSR